MSLVALSPGTVTLTLRDADQTQQLVLSVGTPGPAGPAGANGANGADGAPGVGVPAGGLEGQVLVKATDVSYDTAWVDNYALQVRAQVRNETGATLTKGTVVYINGGAGNKVTVTKAIATGDATSAQTFGVIIADIPTNQNGYACVLGLLTGLNTLAYTEGQQLYLSPTTAGTVTTTKPLAPYHMVYVAIVERIHGTQGSILVRVQNGFEVEELHDAAISSAANNDLFVYESATSLWKYKCFATLGLLTVSAGDAAYYPLSSNPAAYIDASALSGYAPLTAPYFNGGITADGGVSVPGPSGTASFDYNGLNLGGSSGGITFADSSVQITAALPYTVNQKQADIIASEIFTIGTTADSAGFNWGSPPKFVLALGSNWGIYDSGTSSYHYAALATGNTVYFSGTWGSGPWFVRVNGEDSSFSITP